MSPRVKRQLLLKCLSKSYLFRTRTNETHFAFKDVPELRNLVKAKSPNKSSNTGDAWIGGRHELWAVFLCVNLHRPELHHFERPSALAHSLLPIQNGTWRVQLDEDRQEDRER